ncbi:hypothetical protein [Ferruginibacter sp. SUN106]|uniref:ORC-CDC6 family AAA ATPase n=1 Tax=Ferruginibacter sp. SUN106 TaxID=2978348 RepID=UPI003D365EDA
MATEYRNPFSKIRTEQMGDSAWKYFVEPSKEYIGDKPLIFEGSRGTGKTMFFKCNSWKEKLEEAKSKGEAVSEFIAKTNHFGFYYKVDGRFIKSLTGKKIDDTIWIGIFNTYFNVVIAKEIIAFFQFLIQENIISEEILHDAITQICLMLDVTEINKLNELKSKIEITLVKIEKFSNNTNLAENNYPIGLNAGTIIEKLILAIKQNASLKNKTFHVFIDEYEVFNKQQQIELNTLLKQSNSDLVYDFGVITNGIISFETASGQILKRKDDFFLFSTDRYGYYESKEYNQLLNEICKKRLKEEFDKTGKKYDDKFLDIGFYLKNYGKKFEEDEFSKSPYLNDLKEKVLKEIKRQARLYGYDETEIEIYYKELTNCAPVAMRVHLALLMRKNRSIVPAKELLTHKIQKSKKYEDWLHNIETAALYLLCNEFKVEKKYHGIQVYSALSSGVIRSFLELAEYAFDYALSDIQSPFSFESPREFSIEEQTKAVYFVSNFKIKEIESYEPHGYKLKDFTKALGRIFKNIQLNPYATLGEVEQNHFSTNENELIEKKKNEADVFKSAVRNKILEDGDPTKTKLNNTVELTDYHLNHIYCPAFSISHRRQNKISIAYPELVKLLSGNHKELEEAVKQLSGISEDSSPTLFSDSNELSREI